MKNDRKRKNLKSLVGIMGMLTCVLFLSSSSQGCLDCADYDEYCVELDCCDDYSCDYDETAGYRCR